MKTKTLAFCQFFKELRFRKQITLRDFCRQSGADPANISRMERGMMPPPKSDEILQRYAATLGIEKGSDDWYSFFDLAMTSAGMIPKDILSDKELVRKLPLFFRTLRGDKPTKDEMKRLAEELRKN